MRPDRARLEDVLASIKNINEELPNSFEDFSASKMKQVWVAHHLLIIGEAINKLSRQLKAENPDPLWQDFADLRHLIVHEYFYINPDEIWATAVTDLPKLTALVDRTLAGLL